MTQICLESRQTKTEGLCISVYRNVTGVAAPFKGQIGGALSVSSLVYI